MAEDATSVSLFDQLGATGFRASIITTYSCYLPFYEQVVLRRLVAAGCTHNLVFVDAGRLGEALGVAEQRPRLAGTAYTLIPVHRSGAFHPKVLLQVGPTKGALLVGSHNLTLSGFGLNDELTSGFRAEGSNPRSAAAPFHVAREFLRSFLPVRVPEVGDAFDAVFDGAQWLNGPALVGGPPRELVTSTGESLSLWDRVRTAVPKGVTRALVVSPFFDGSLEFLRRLLEDVRPASLTVAIDPSSAVIPRDAPSRLPGVRFVNIAGRSLVPLTRRREGAARYMHAKAIWFESAQSELLVTGSANASAPAFLSGAGRRNAEAVVIDATPGVADDLGLKSFFDAPELSSVDWANVAIVEAPGEAELDVSTVLLATPSEHGFVLSGAVPEDAVLVAADQEGCELGASSFEARTPAATVVVRPEIRDQTVFLLGCSSTGRITAVVHRPDEIARHAATDSRKALKQALGALEDDPAQIAALLRVTEKVIFDVPENVAGAPTDVLRGDAESDAQQQPPDVQTLAIEAQGRRTARKRSLARGDLAYLLDALIRRLGDGLASSGPTQPLEEEEIGADQEHGGDLGNAIEAAIDLGKVAQACRSKTKKLVKRMLASLENVTGPGQAHRAVVQLAAVAGVLRALVLLERRPEWRRARHQLVDPDALFELADRATIALLARGEGLLAQAQREVGSAFEEVSSTVGLVAALMYLCEIDATAGPPRAELFEEPPDERDHWYAVQAFATLAPALALDVDAQTTLAQSIERFVANGRWLPDHLALAEALANLETAPPTTTSRKGPPQRGDWVVVPASFSPRVRVILDVLPAAGGPKVVVTDFSNDSGERVFLAPRVAIVPRRDLVAAKRVAAGA